MSYILDALRKADAERDRGNVPGIHAQPSFGGGAPSSAQPAAKPWLWLAGGAGAVAIVGASAWYVMAPPRGGADLAAAPAVATAPPLVTTAPVPIATAPSSTPVQTPAQATAPKAEAAPAPVVRKPKAAPPVTNSEPTAAATAPATEGKPAAAVEKVYTVAELPDDIRRQLPNLSIGGAMYSSKPADRILIINGQVLHEGEPIAPDLTLQQIRLKSALLNFKGYRYTIGF